MVTLSYRARSIGLRVCAPLGEISIPKTIFCTGSESFILCGELCPLGRALTAHGGPQPFQFGAPLCVNLVDAVERGCLQVIDLPHGLGMGCSKRFNGRQGCRFNIRDIGGGLLPDRMACHRGVRPRPTTRLLNARGDGRFLSLHGATDLRLGRFSGDTQLIGYIRQRVGNGLIESVGDTGKKPVGAICSPATLRLSRGTFSG